ncbi:MAG: hypothetical protein A2W90_17140 [Bacteroidetes bacterium GWF2_42_66]|nr:MAG: hypothetical protein A2W92_15595 [Bacteroidetes bacterium GWA2_42_15]OFX97744.1 MAG: hypothetical protein A2W89_06895 [Bacteroidetes bacterium GWE2_42_39]OFY45517.1 MAG: hypothetical protein A2W90_17140 [Bacteroidetes bacterium GWF2_42_66]HAZ02867.1 hypothetical protein [Marinilabiliales bacterium]HBL73813.1 hypothetical protein [Prolixibacteraceae bacterium]
MDWRIFGVAECTFPAQCDRYVPSRNRKFDWCNILIYLRFELLIYLIMAKQKGVIKLEGSIGDISFYKGRDGNFMARTKGGISGDRIKNDPAFERTRENGQEFGKAGKAGKLVRAAFREVIKTNRDSRMSNRLTQEMMKVIQTDTTNLRGNVEI